MCCGGRIAICDGMSVCCNCGHVLDLMPVVLRRQFCPAGEATRQPYSRSKRFARIFQNSFGRRVPTTHAFLIKAIQKARPTSPEDIFSVIYTSTDRRLKRYDALAFLSLNLLPGWEILPLRSQDIAFAEELFRSIERSYNIRLFAHSPFPAYAFIVEQILVSPNVNRPDLLRYIHKLKCKRRRSLYKKLYFTPGNTGNQASLVEPTVYPPCIRASRQ